MSERGHRSNSFVLRIWWEKDAQPLWRGWVQHAASGESHYFDRLDDLLAFLEMHTGSLAQAPAGRDCEPGEGDPQEVHL